MNFREKKYEKKRKSFGHSPAKFESRAVHFFGKNGYTKRLCGYPVVLTTT